LEQELWCLIGFIDGLDEHRTVDIVRHEVWDEVVHRESAVKCGQSFGPRLVSNGEIPEVMVRVNT
jgi:hypothetical protein